MEADGTVWAAVRRIESACDSLRSSGRGGGSAGASARFDAALARCSIRAPDGLPPGPMLHLVRFWTEVDLPITKWTAIGQCIIPQSKVSEDVVSHLVRWMRTNFKDLNCFKKIVFMLNWLQGLMEFRLLDSNVLDIHFEFFFFLLRCSKFSFYASKFVYFLSRPHDVTRSRVLQILQTINSERQSKVYNALYAILNLYKSFNPTCVLEDIHTLPIDEVFPKIPSSVLDGFHHAQIRSSIQQALASESKLIWWIASEHQNKQMRLLIPSIDYFHLNTSREGISKYDKKKTCLEFESIKELMNQNIQNSVDAPANMMSLLINNAGLYMIIFSNENLKSRFSYTLYETLHNNFIKSNTMSYGTKRVLLGRLVLLQKYLLQGIPAISNFLALYLPIWNGDDFYVEIFALLEWITFESFEELYDCILVHIEMLYLTGSCYYRCSVVNLLKNLYVNLSDTMTSNETNLFLNRKTRDDPANVLVNLAAFMNDLCDRSVQSLHESPLLQDAFLDAYITIADLQSSYRSSLWTIVPEGLVYSTLCSLSAYSINKIAKLFLRYYEIYKRIKQVEGKENIKHQIMLLQSYHIDYINCLWFGKSFANYKQGLLFNKIPRGMIEHLQMVMPDDYDKWLHICKHVAFAPHTYLKIPFSLKRCFNKDAIISLISPIFPHIFEYVNIVMKYQNYQIF